MHKDHEARLPAAFPEEISRRGAAVRWLSLFSSALLFSACAFVPPPEIPETVDVISAAPGYSTNPRVKNGVSADQLLWWRKIGGAELASWVTRLKQHNFELAEARERVVQANEFAKQARSGRLPRVSGDLGASRNRTSDLFGKFDWGDQYSAGLGASLDTDIFGGLRAAERSAILSAEAARLNYIATEQRSIEALARAWVGAAAQGSRLALARENAESFRVTYNLTDERHRAGSANTTASDVLIARQNLDAALAEIPAVEAQFSAQLLAIDQQLAHTPGTIARTFKGEMSVSPRMTVPVGFPAALLTARPDVAAAELSYRSALQDVGTARADLLPKLSLNASLSFQNENAADLFDLDRYIANLAASLTQPVFQGGLLQSRLRVEKSRARELSTAYARIALNAFSQVETALVRQSGAQQQLEQLQKTLLTAEDSNRLVQDRYRQGLQPMLAVLETQRGLNSAKQNIIATEQALLEARIALHLSLGGSWFGATPD